MILHKFKEVLKEIRNQNNELIWAKVWDDTIRNVVWLQELPSISPGRWAVGYNYLYVMTRILIGIKPHSVLDLGLGISSTLISKWFSFANYSDVTYTIVEQDKEWVDFYLKSNSIFDNCDLIVTECIKKDFKGYDCYIYKNFKKLLSGKKYSVISIDGPWGSNRYSRRDIVELLPDILEKNFVIIMDDTDRKGENDTIEEIKRILNDRGIAYVLGVYPSISDCTVICSENYKFLCSL